MQKVRKIGILILLVMLCSIFSRSYAITTMTKEELTNGIQKISEESESNITVTDNEIIITMNEEGEKESITYNLEEKPTFSIKVPIRQGMSYKEFSEKVENLSLVLVPYLAIADANGVDYATAAMYFLFSAASEQEKIENPYIIVDDINLEDGVTIDKSSRDEKTIYASEFPERVMEYVNATYKDKTISKDSSELDEDCIDSYEWTIERTDVEEDSCNLVSTLTVNLDAEFSKIDTDIIPTVPLLSEITKENADYKIELKVGQTCKIISNENLSIGTFVTNGIKCDLVDSNNIEIIGETVGESNGYIYVGEEEKTVFVTVEENVENESLETKVININTVTDSGNKPQEKPSINNNDNNQNINPENPTTAKTPLPATGIKGIIGVVSLSLVSIIIFSIKLKQNKDIK